MCAKMFSPSIHRKEKEQVYFPALFLWRRRRDTAVSGRLLAACCGESSTHRCRTRLVRRTDFCACAQKCSHPPCTAKKKAPQGCFFLWRRRRDTAASGRLLAACSGGSLMHRCNTRLVRQTDFCACAQKCSHPPYTAKKKSTTRVLFSLAEKEGYCRKRQVTRSVLRWKFNASV